MAATPQLVVGKALHLRSLTTKILLRSECTRIQQWHLRKFKLEKSRYTILVDLANSVLNFIDKLNVNPSEGARLRDYIELRRQEGVCLPHPHEQDYGI
jgi:hypothetical protein